jgi:nicotinate phosphoribosyltransferase
MEIHNQRMSRTEASQALFTDLYELTMAQAYWQAGQTAGGTFSLFIRSYPPDRGYFVFAGLDDVLDYLEALRFTAADLAYLRSLGMFTDEFLDFLAGLRFTGSVRAMPEGSLFFANEPVLEVTAPVIEGQLVETYLLNQVNLQSLLTTKASRVVQAARGRTLVDFGARRAHGIDAADRLARLSYMAGFDGTSNLAAAARYDLPAFGTMAHSFVGTFEDEVDAFRAYARSFPARSTFLVDTYDTLTGVDRAIEVAEEMRAAGHQLVALRLDSGELATLARETRRRLDAAGLFQVQVFASGGLDEFEIEELLASGAPIGGFGVGTKVGVSADAPWTDCAYKLVEYDGRPLLKLSTGKATLTGAKQVFRCLAEGSGPSDVIALAGEKGQPGALPLLQPVMAGGKRLQAPAPLRELRERVAANLGALPEEYRALRSPACYPVETSSALALLTERARESITSQSLGESG